MLIFKNLLRRKGRTVLSVLGIALGIAAIIAFNAVGQGFKDSLNQYSREMGAELVVLGRDVPTAEYSRITADEMKSIGEMEGVAQFSGVAFYASLIVKPALLLFGRVPGERPMLRYRNKEFQGELVRADDEIMLSSLSATKMKKKVGDEVELFKGKKFKVVGIYSVTTWENMGAVITTRVIQKEFGMGDAVQMGFLYLEPGADRNGVKAELEKRYPYLVAVRSEDFAANFENLQYVDWFVWIISLISVVVGGLGVLNTMLMSVGERTREIGTLRAVGWSSGRVLRLILSEGTLISFVGGVLGLAVGVAGAEILIRWAPQGYLGTAYSTLLFVEAMVVAVVLGLVGALYPAYRASRLSPIEALKYE